MKKIEELSLLEKLYYWLKKLFVAYKVPFLSAICCGLLAYGFIITNQLVNHDLPANLFIKGMTLSSGRWALVFLELIFPNFSMPWIYGVISIILYSVSACIIVDIFSFKSKLSQILIACLVITFPSLIGTFTYTFTVSSYAVCFLFSVLSVKFFIGDSLWKKIIAILFLAFSLGIYQAYIAVCASMLILILLREVLRGEKSELLIIKDGFKYFFFLVISLLLYYIIMQISLKVTGVEFNSYAASAVENTKITIFDKINLAYKYFFEILFESKHSLILSGLYRITHIVIIVIGLINLFCMFIKKNFISKILIVALLLLFPLSVNCMYLFVAQDSVHALVLYSFVTLYIFSIIMMEAYFRYPAVSKLKKLWGKTTKEVTMIGMLLLIISNIYTANMVYTRMTMAYENAYSYYTSLVAQIKSTPGYASDTKVVLIGTPSSSNYNTKYFGYDSHIIGTVGYGVNSYSRYDFLKYFIGFEIADISKTEKEEIKNTEEFNEMSYYPYYNSIKKIGDYLVVKMGF